MPSADPKIPQPTKGFLVNFNNPCIAPSSPFFPCRRGNQISTLLNSIFSRKLIFS